MQEYYLGLDMGTSSVGWAVTDENYKLIRAKGKDLWGIRLFKEAETAAGRRVNRIAKRRRQREVARIGLLKDFFAEEILKIDPNFYERLEDSKYFIEDKRMNSKFGIFADKNFTDKQYYEKFPTIFHLRMELINSEEKQDIRLIYLALLNIFKHRGHFLDKNISNDVNTNQLDASYKSIAELAEQLLGLQFTQNIDYKIFEEILKEKGISRTARAEKIAAFLEAPKKEKAKYEIIKGVCGLDITLTTIFGDVAIDEAGKPLKLGFTKSNYEENATKAAAILGDEYFELVNAIKVLHDIGVFMGVMKGHQYLSEARIESYEKHKKDLRLLKDVILEYVPEKYDNLFRNEVDGSYSAYVKSYNSDKKMRRGMKKTTVGDLYDTIKSILKDFAEKDDRISYILHEIQTEEFLPKQLTWANGVISNTVHTKELRHILENAKKHYAFLNEKDETNLSVAEKIEQIFSFQIPYYIGPLNEQHKGKGGNVWVIRKEGTKGPILPWNFEEKIDTMATAEQFIVRMVRRCTYLSEENCLPESSLLYEKFKVLNELNNVKVNGEKLSVNLKQKIYNQLFLKGKKVTQKQLCTFLMGENAGIQISSEDISGIDGDFKNTLSSYGKFKEVFGEDMQLDSVKDMVEHIIYFGTIYGDDKKFLKKRIKDQYKNQITQEQLNRICGFKFKTWGNLSKSFLELAGCDKLIGESTSIIKMMWDSNENLMELLSERYTYLDSLEEKCKHIEKPLAEFEYEDLEQSYLSMPVKRMIWQTIQIIQELEVVLGNRPKKIFVEMAKGPEEKKRTTSRKAKLLDLYKGCKKDTRDWCAEIGKYEEMQLRSKKLYLYYLQKGRCMYTGAEIDFDKLMNSNSYYDIDHIYPQSYVKDDSLENNLVLVDQDANRRKKDVYPINEDIFEAQKNYWKSLEKSGFITKEKYNRLMCRDKFSDEQMAGFINRQLVETRQGTKVITQILKQTCNTSEVIYVKGSNVSEFRRNSMFILNRGKENEEDLRPIKCRSVNDFHHAHDAYLNIVVGNVYHVKFTKSPLTYIRENRKQKDDHSQKSPYHMDKIFAFDVIRGKEWAWKVKAQDGQMNSRDMVLKMLHKATPLITYMTLSGSGELFKALPVTSRIAKNKKYFPLKTSKEQMIDVTKYGGFAKVSIAFFTVIEYEDQKGKKMRTIEAMPIYYFKKKISTELVRRYCEEIMGLKKVSVRVLNIPIHALLRVDGYYVRITAKTNDQYAISNMVPMVLGQRDITYIKWIDECETDSIKAGIKIERNLELYDNLVEKHATTIFAKKGNSILKILEAGREAFIKLSIDKQCVILKEILKNTTLSNETSDLSDIGGKKENGKVYLGKNINNKNEVILIHQSVTGLFVKEVDLLTV